MAKTPRPATDAGISIGQVFLGKYRVEEILGQGGMGIVARCTHLVLDEQVAIKMLRPDVLLDHDATSRFMREAQAAVKLRSEYVARVHDVGTLENGVPYMVMEFLDGHDLDQMLEQQHQFAVPWAVDLMLQTAEALAEAHAANIVHRDVKPSNLFVTWRPDGTSLIKVLDFGISKSPMGTDMQLTQTQSLLGTPAYMSPEQMRSARLVDGRTDIWSLGTVMYELIEGRRPFEADSFSEMCVKVAVDAPEPMRNAPPGLQDVILRCLSKSPDQRYANMAELGRDLIPFARDAQQASMLVERMFRMVGRASSGGWEGTTTGSGIQALRTPPRGIPRTPQPMVPATVERSSVAPAAPPIDVATKPAKSKRGLVVGLLLAAATAAGVVAALLYTQANHESEPAAANAPPVEVAPPSTAGTAAPVVDPPSDSAKTVDPAPTPVEEVAKPEAPVDDIEMPEETVAKKPQKKQQRKKPDRAAVKPDKPDKKPEKADKTETAEPAKPEPPKRDPYATPRPTPRPK